MEPKFVRVSDYMFVNLSNVAYVDVDDSIDLEVDGATLHMVDGTQITCNQPYISDFIDTITGAKND